MKYSKQVTTTLASHFKLSANFHSYDDKEEISKIRYASVIGSLRYAMICTHLNIAHLVRVVNKFLANLDKQHWQAVKWILRYLKGTSNHCLCFGNNNVALEGYIDANMATCVDTVNYITSYLYPFVGATMS